MTTRPTTVRRPHHLLRLVCWILLLVPIAVTSTPPALPPYHVYYVHGSIERTGGGTLDGFAIVLMFRESSGWRFGTPDLTDEQGRFQVRTGEFYEELDSLVLAMVNPDTVLAGAPFPTSEDPGLPIESLHNRTDEGFLCDDIESSWEVDRYDHFYTDKVLPLP